MKTASEVGPDLSRFANVKHFCSWLGLCSTTKISGGKVLSAKTYVQNNAKEGLGVTFTEEPRSVRCEQLRRAALAFVPSHRDRRLRTRFWEPRLSYALPR